jgi:hypothetical protein
MTTAPSTDPARFDAIYADLSTMHVELDADPLALGPKRLNMKIAECRAMLSRCERIFLDVSQDLHWYKREHRRAQADFKLEVQGLLANDPEVRAGRNVADREAIAATKLRSSREEIDKLVFAVEDLEAVLTVVRTKRADLKDISSRLRDQLKICQEEINLGARWGIRSASSPARGAIPDPAASGVDELLDSVLSTLDTTPLTPPSDVPDLQGEAGVSDTTADAVIDEVVGSLPDKRELPSPSVAADQIDSLIDLF